MRAKQQEMLLFPSGQELAGVRSCCHLLCFFSSSKCLLLNWLCFLFSQEGVLGRAGGRSAPRGNGRKWARLLVPWKQSQRPSCSLCQTRWKTHGLWPSWLSLLPSHVPVSLDPSRPGGGDCHLTVQSQKPRRTEVPGFPYSHSLGRAEPRVWAPQPPSPS